MVRNHAGAAAFARQATALADVPSQSVAVFFATGSENLYQFEQWRRPLEALSERQPVFVVVDRPDTGRALLDATAVPVHFARRSAELERLVIERQVRVVLYLNQVEPNFRMLRFASPVHIQIGHGESDKGGSVSNQHKAYDLTFVSGRAGRERLGKELRNFDADTRTVLVGRPQLDFDYAGAPAWHRDSGRRVLYAPTWEGDRPSIAYGSLASHGIALVRALRAEAATRIIYRPHPRTGQASAAHAHADAEIRALLAADGDRHLVDTGPYGWQWGFADACITDVSAVAYDWLATGKPLVITKPNPSAVLPPSPLLATVPLLPAAAADQIVSWLRKASTPAALDPLGELTAYYFGDTARGASTARFEAAVAAAVQQAAVQQAAGQKPAGQRAAVPPGSASAL